MVRNCDVIAGYKTYPHVDQYEAGQLAGSILLRYAQRRSQAGDGVGQRTVARPDAAAEHRRKPHEGLRRRRSRRGAQRPARRNRVRWVPAGRHPRCRIERGGRRERRPRPCRRAACKASSTSPGVTRRTSSTAASRSSRRSRAPSAWPKRAAGRSCCSIMPTTARPGATQDTMYVLKEALRQGLTGIAVGPMRDPEAVRQHDRGRRGRQGHANGRAARWTCRRSDAQGRAAGADRRGARHHRRRVHHHRPAVPGHALLHGPHAPCWTPGARRDRGHRAQPGAVGSRRVHQRRHRPRPPSASCCSSRACTSGPVFLPIAKGMVFCDSTGVGSSDWTQFEYRSCAGRFIRWTSFPPSTAKPSPLLLEEGRRSRQQGGGGKRTLNPD